MKQCYQFHLQMLAIESGKAAQSSDDVCFGVLDLVFITTVVHRAVESKALFANSTQTYFRAEGNEFLTKLWMQTQHIQDKLLQTLSEISLHAPTITNRTGSLLCWNNLSISLKSKERKVGIQGSLLKST